MMERTKLEGHAAVLLANVIFGLGVPVTKLLLDHWVSPMAYMATRCIGAAAISGSSRCSHPVSTWSAAT
jgi:drug/metabolite transporter (DMT)-like permease